MFRLLLVQSKSKREFSFHIWLAFTSQFASELLYDFLRDVQSQPDSVSIYILSITQEPEKFE